MFGKEEEKKKDQISLSELDERLLADKDGSVKKEILEKLKAYQEKVDSKINKGELAPNEFEAAKSVSAAIREAHSIVFDR